MTTKIATRPNENALHLKVRHEKPSTVERVLIDMQGLAESFFGSPRSPKGIEMQWREDQDVTETTADVEERDEPTNATGTSTGLTAVVAETAGKPTKGYPRQSAAEVRTSSRHLAMVLGKVVEVVTAAARSGSTTYDCSALEALVQTMKAQRGKPTGYSDEVCLTYADLNSVVMRLVANSKESVALGTKVPTGICISNFGSKQCCLDLFWGKSGNADRVAVRTSMNPIPEKASF